MSAWLIVVTANAQTTGIAEDTAYDHRVVVVAETLDAALVDLYADAHQRGKTPGIVQSVTRIADNVIWRTPQV